MSDVIVRKCAPDGTPVFDYHASVSDRTDSGVRLAARWERTTLDLGYTRFETGDHFTEWFYADRWYNVLEVRGARDGALKGWYCNIAYPASIEWDVIAYRDLYLDVWVGPDGRVCVLDEDEFEAAALDSGIRQQARAGLRDLLAVIERRQSPFDALNTP